MSKELTADYFIAGCGIAGALLAAKLADSGKKIIITEQGPRFTEADRAGMLFRGKESLNDYADYNDNTDPAAVTPHTSATKGEQVVEWSAMRLFGVGGTALHFEGIMVRPREEDFRVKTLFGYGRDWPITYSELEPWLLRAEQETGVAGGDDNPYASHRSGPYPMPAHALSYYDREIFAPALKKLGITGHSCPRAINSQPYRERSACLTCRICKFCPSGARYSPDRDHIKKFEQNPNVMILDSVSLRRLETNPKGDRITAAHAMHIKDRKPIVIKAANYILAMGGVETPRMLLLSAGSGPHSNGLGNMGGQLGRHFSDHLNPYVTFDVGRPVGGRLGFETMISDHFRVKVDRRENPAYMIFSSPSMDWFPIGIEAAQWATKGGILSMKDLRSGISHMATLSTMTELSGSGTLELDKEKLDHFGSPVAKVTMRMTDWDRRGSAQLGELAPRIADAMGAARVSEVTPPDFGMGYHPSGASAMAESPDQGVCDSDLKVFGVNNLYLASNSVFPQMGANPATLAIGALALRLAAHLEGGSK